jgi:hypothetical protein
MTTSEPKRCQNPFFPCTNTNPEIKIVLDICVKGEKYPICESCWPIIAESENYQWTQPAPEEKEKDLQFEPNFNSAPTEQAEQD